MAIDLKGTLSINNQLFICILYYNVTIYSEILYGVAGKLAPIARG
jgi:hypothetical protein